jgi:mono/diheme cytochrome c family protein
LKAVPAVLALVLLAACGGEQQQRASQPAPKGDPGLKVWAAQGCGSCHTFAPAGSTATIGPNLGNSLGGRSRDYIRESIVAPNARVPGGGTSIMPADFAKRISKPELDALVKFIADGVRAR